MDEIHIMQAEETSSEAMKNYGAAAFLIGLAVFWTAVGIGSAVEGIRSRKGPEAKPKAKPLPEAKGRFSDLGKKFAESMRTPKPSDVIVGEKIPVEIVTGDADITYYVKKSYKEEVTVGVLIPETFLSVRTESMNDIDWAKMDNVKVKSRHTVNLDGGITLVKVDKVL